MKKLIPPFLKRLDDYLLLNHPIVWISRIHYVLFYGVLMSGFSALIGAIIPLNLIKPQDLALWYFLFSVLAVVALCFWIYRVVIFNIEKKFGNRKWTDEYKVFFLNFACVLIFVSFPFPFTGIYNSRVANFVTDAEFIADINTLNRAEPYMITEPENYASNYDTIENVSYYNFKQMDLFDVNTPWVIKSDTLTFPTLLSPYQLQKRYEPAAPKAAVVAKINDAFVIHKKYRLLLKPFDGNADLVYKRYRELYSMSPVSYDDYSKFGYVSNNSYSLSRVLANVAEAKFRPLFLWDKEFLTFMFYMCFYVAVLVMLFKMVNWRQYLVAAVSLILIPILLFIISELVPYDYYSGNFNRRENIFMLLAVVLFFVAMAFTIRNYFQNNRFSAFTNVCSQLFYVCFPFFPIIIVVLLKQQFDVFGNSDSYYDDSIRYDESLTATAGDGNYYTTAPYIYNELLREYWYQQFKLWITGMMYGGMAFFILVLLPLMKQLFVKQLALPRKQ